MKRYSTHGVYWICVYGTVILSIFVVVVAFITQIECDFQLICHFGLTRSRHLIISSNFTCHTRKNTLIIKCMFIEQFLKLINELWCVFLKIKRPFFPRISNYYDKWMAEALFSQLNLHMLLIIHFSSYLFMLFNSLFITTVKPFISPRKRFPIRANVYIDGMSKI